MVDGLSGLGQGLALLALSPGLTGLLRWLKALAQGRRRGAWTIAQPYCDLRQLLGQPSVRAEETPWVFGVAPLVLWTCYGTLAFAVPLFGQPPLLKIDLIALISLLALARFALALAGLAAGAPFGGLGGSRSMFLNLPTEVALALILAALVLHEYPLSVWALVQGQQKLGGEYLLEPDLVLIAAALAIAILLEAGRLPINNLATHLELTMIHKAIVLEYAGRDLALVEWAEAIKLTVLLTLFVSLFLPMQLWPLALAMLAVAGFLRAWAEFGRVEPAILLFLAILPFVLLGSTDWVVWLAVRWASVLDGLKIAIWSLPMLVCALVFLALAEAGRPKRRLRKVVGQAVVAGGLSLLAILYLVVSTLGASR